MSKVKKIVSLSWVKQQAQDEFEQLKTLPDLDPEFFTNEELEHYVRVLIARHKGDWIVVENKKVDKDE